MKKTIFIIYITFTSILSLAQSGTVQGFLYEKETGEPLMFSNVYLKNTNIGIATDVNGFYSLTKVPVGTYNLIITSIGFDTINEQITIDKNSIVKKTYQLISSSTNIDVVEVFGEKIDRSTNVSVAVTKVTARKIKQLPSIGGEPDLAQYLQTLPGVVFTGDQGGQLYIRGGSPVQNLSLIDGMQIFNPFHSIGLFSVFDTDLLRSVDVYTGGFKSDYGGRVSSVIDIKTRDGNKKNFGGKISANPFTSKFMLEGPLSKKSDGNSGSSFLFSQRYSYLDKAAPIFYPYINKGSLPYNFNDTYGKIVMQTSTGSKVSFSGFNFTDRANLDSLNDISWRNYGFGSNFLLLPNGSSTVVTGNVGYSNYRIDISEQSLSPRYSTIDNFNFGLDFNYFIKKDELKYGVAFVSGTTEFQAPNSKGLQSNPITSNNTELFGYFRYNLVRKRYVVEPSIRMHYYASLGQMSPEPRLGVKYILTDKIRLKFAGGIFSQNLIATRSDRDVVNLFAGFISSPDRIVDVNGDRVNNKLQTARHAIFGIEFDLNDNWEIDLEPYIKEFAQLINVNRDYTIDADYMVENGRATGIDFQARYQKHKTYFQFGYSLGRVFRNGVIDFTKEIKKYPTNFDRRHNINLLFSQKFGKNNSWEFSTRWNFGSGFPFTQTQAFYEDFTFNNGIDQNLTTANGDLGIIYAPLNGGRLPVYHRLDLSVKKTIKFEKSEMEINGGLINTYNRRNLFYVDRVTSLQTYQLPLIPSLGMNWSF